MTAPTRTRSQIGRASRAKGARFEVAVANGIRPWFPDARRARDNGSATTADTGDLAGAGERLFWSLKDDRQGVSSPPGLINAWLTEAIRKGAGRIPLLAQKRGGHADPLRSWCWLWLPDLVEITGGDSWPTPCVPVRLELGDLLPVLVRAGLTDANPQLEMSGS